jgi:23S rRNA pseudouridine1911/1915/1917 synthase
MPWSMASSTDPSASLPPAPDAAPSPPEGASGAPGSGLADVDWLPAGFNAGFSYRDRVQAPEESVAAFYAARHRHSPLEVWLNRLAAGEIWRNGQRLHGDGPLRAGDHLRWRRPPWREEAVPARWRVVHDDGDLQVIDKPSGLPVLPAGGWLDHTVLRLMERRHRQDPRGVPRPVHRLGRFTSGLLVCARQAASRRWLSARLRESTAALAGPEGAPSLCRKVYEALLVPGRLPATLAPGDVLTLTTAIGRRSHPRLGWIWCAALVERPGDLAALSRLTLLERGGAGDRVEVAIASGRPHQIRIHCAALGAPLLGDPLYLPGGLAREERLPGEGGYQLRARRLELSRPDGSRLRLVAGSREGAGP